MEGPGGSVQEGDPEIVAHDRKNPPLGVLGWLTWLSTGRRGRCCRGQSRRWAERLWRWVVLGYRRLRSCQRPRGWGIEHWWDWSRNPELRELRQGR